MTAEEFSEHIEENGKYTFDWKEIAIRFAKYHVEKALKAASEEFKAEKYIQVISESYPLTNIK